jgi:hypothetical protein
MLSTLKRNIARHITNFPGWRTERKIVVIDSDDWGSIRMPSRGVYQQCLASGYMVDQIAYERFDSLASEEDLEFLFEVLDSHKDQHGIPAVITANILAANPDFNKIRETGYQQYFYELITDTFARYPKHANCLNLWKNGKEHGVFFPQSHGREHLNVSLLMDRLQLGDEDVLFGFEHGMPGSISGQDPLKGNVFVESLRYTDHRDKLQKLSFILEGLDLFEALMGYKSQSFIPPNYIWSPDFDKELATKGVQYYQGNRKMIEPLLNGSYRIHNNSLGEENELGQKYLVRNATFEPSLFNAGADSVTDCLQDITAAFRMQKPAIVCSHRLNYVGFIDKQNRDTNVKMLDELLSEITKKWPDVEFLNSVQLGKLMV